FGRGPQAYVEILTVVTNTWQGHGVADFPQGSPQNSVALVTGAGRGIGRAAAHRLSAEGLKVALSARNETELAETAEGCVGETMVVPADMTDPAAIDQLF